jgi:hypothetical protein
MTARPRIDFAARRKPYLCAAAILAIGLLLGACDTSASPSAPPSTSAPLPTTAPAPTTTTVAAAFIAPNSKAPPNLGMNVQFAEELIGAGFVPFQYTQKSPGIVEGMPVRTNDGVNLPNFASRVTIYGSPAVVKVQVATTYESSPNDGSLTTYTATEQLALDDVICGEFGGGTEPGGQAVQDWCRSEIENTTTASETVPVELEQGHITINVRFSVIMGYAGLVEIEIVPAPAGTAAAASAPSAGASRSSPSLTWLNKYAEPWNKKMNADANTVDSESAKPQTPVVPYWNRVTAACTKLEKDATSALKEPTSPDANLTKLWDAMVGQTITYAKDCIAIPLSNTPKQAAQTLTSASNVLATRITNWNTGVTELRAGKRVTLSSTPTSSTVSTTTTTLPTPTTQAVNPDIAIFDSFVAKVKTDLSDCVNGATDVQLDIGMLAGNTGNSGEAQLDTYTKNAETDCDVMKDQGIENLIGLSVPGTLAILNQNGGVPSELENWSTSDTTAVLHDLQAILEASGSTVAAQSQLQTDTATADQDESTIEAQFDQEAKQVGISNFGGLGLVVWNSGSGNS